MIEIGGQVVCIGVPDGTRPRKQPLHTLEIGRIYTVRAILKVNPERYFPGLEVPKAGLHLKELVNPPRPIYPDGKMMEPGYNIVHFRPVKRTSIAVFEQMLDPEFTELQRKIGLRMVEVEK